ncbi:unnamed protein product [Urochloa humidicola]
MPKVKNPHVFLDISIGGGNPERITFELFANVVPKTAENFRTLCTGKKGIGASTQKPLHFKGTILHRIVKGFIAQGGDFSRGDGLGVEGIYGGNFPNENFRLSHDQPGVLSMTGGGPNRTDPNFLQHYSGMYLVLMANTWSLGRWSVE